MDTLRLSNADREAAVDLLGEQYAVGRLNKEEFDERSDAVWSAKTRGDLAPVFADLPVSSPAQPNRQLRSSAWGARRGRWWPFPLAPILFVLIALTVLTHLPFVLLALLAVFLFGRFRHGSCSSHRQLH